MGENVKIKTVKEVSALPVTGKKNFHSIEGTPNLYVVVSPGGTKAYVWRGRVGDKIVPETLGKVSAMTWTEAKDAANKITRDRNRGDLAVRIETEAKDKVEAERSVDWLFKQYMDGEGRHRKSAGAKRARYANDIEPVIGNRSIYAITHDDLARLVDTKKAASESASTQVRALVRRMFRWAVAEARHITELTADPAAFLPKPPKPVTRDRYLAEWELLYFLRALEHRKLAAYRQPLWLILLTGCRRNEAFAAPFAEFDLDKAEWVIPGSRTKNGEELVLPLPSVAVELVRSVKRKERQTLLWPSIARAAADRDRPDEAISGYSDCIDAMNIVTGLFAEKDGRTIEHFTLHDLRRTVSTNMHGMLDADHRPLISEITVEKIINHKIAGVAGIYNRWEYHAEKKIALQLWADKLEALKAKAISGEEIAPPHSAAIQSSAAPA